MQLISPVVPQSAAIIQIRNFEGAFFFHLFGGEWWEIKCAELAVLAELAEGSTGIQFLPWSLIILIRAELKQLKGVTS